MIVEAKEARDIIRLLAVVLYAALGSQACELHAALPSAPLQVG
jgi:hypothetical protein